MTAELNEMQQYTKLATGNRLLFSTEDSDDEDDFNPLIEIQELTELEVFMQTLQKAHDAATATECKHQKRNK